MLLVRRAGASRRRFGGDGDQCELDALMSPDVTTIHGARIALADRLHDFYSRREFRAAWTTAQSQGQLLKALADTYEDGLNPADYHLPLLQELSTQVAAPDATDALKAKYDILLTEAGLRAAYHLAFGKVAPESFDAQWNYGSHAAQRRISRGRSRTRSPPRLSTTGWRHSNPHFLYTPS